jgi:hypothetical protein
VTDLLLTLVLLGVVAALEAAIQAHDAPPPGPPRRNYDVLAPDGPRVGATRLTPAQRDVLLSLRVFGAKDDTIVVIRPEAADARQ